MRPDQEYNYKFHGLKGENSNPILQAPVVVMMTTFVPLLASTDATEIYKFTSILELNQRSKHAAKSLTCIYRTRQNSTE